VAGDDFPAPDEGFVLTHFIVAADVARSRDFYTGVLGGKVVLDGEPYMRDPDGHLIEVGQTTGALREQ
jgi:catechol 2,3-dioxygenase-like lactoylglutathione lyase family enzyme